MLAHREGRFAPQPAAQETKAVVPREAAGSELNSRSSLPSPFESQPSPAAAADDSARQGDESAGGTSHHGMEVHDHC